MPLVRQQERHLACKNWQLVVGMPTGARYKWSARPTVLRVTLTTATSISLNAVKPRMDWHSGTSISRLSWKQLKKECRLSTLMNFIWTRTWDMKYGNSHTSLPHATGNNKLITAPQCNKEWLQLALNDELLTTNTHLLTTFVFCFVSLFFQKNSKLSWVPKGELLGVDRAGLLWAGCPSC